MCRTTEISGRLQVSSTFTCLAKLEKVRPAWLAGVLLNEFRRVAGHCNLVSYEILTCSPDSIVYSFADGLDWTGVRENYGRRLELCERWQPWEAQRRGTFLINTVLLITVTNTGRTHYAR